jgi:hypothetical protein
MFFFFIFPAVPSALLALGFASGGAGKVIVTGHERKISFATREPEGNPSGENIYCCSVGKRTNV